MTVIVRKLAASDKAAFLSTLDEPDLHWSYEYFRNLESDYAKYLVFLENLERGIDLQTDWVPASTCFCFVGSTIVGALSLRHQLNSILEKWGGHIGYHVAEKHRNQGYATLILQKALTLARNGKLERVLLTCAEGNVASRRVIEKCGGVMQDIFQDQNRTEATLRFWINL